MRQGAWIPQFGRQPWRNTAPGCCLYPRLQRHRCGQRCRRPLRRGQSRRRGGPYPAAKASPGFLLALVRTVGFKWMRSEEGKHIPQIRDLRRAGYASDFAGSLSLIRQTFLHVLFLKHPPIEGQPRCLRTDGNGKQRLLWSISQSVGCRSRLGNINRGARMRCIPI